MKTLLAALALPAAVVADTLCSCSPTSYSFALNFDGKCDETVGFDAQGLEGSICLFTQGGDPNDIDTDIGFGGPTRKLRRLRGEKRRRWDAVLDRVDFGAHVAHAKKAFEAKAKANRSAGRHLQFRQGLDTTPVTVTSITFLEADTTPQLNIINQDSTYFDTTLSDGDTVVFDSVSAQLDADAPLDEQLNLLPGGVMMVLFGTNAEGAVVQNTVAWGYDTSYCTGELLDTGDAIGWVTFEDYVPPIESFCPKDTVSPTPAPVEPAMSAWSAPSKASKSQNMFAKSAKTKSSKGHVVDAKAEKASSSAKAEKMSVATSAKATKIFKDPVADSKSSKGPSDTKGSKMSMPEHDSKSGKAGTGDSKAGKESSDDEGWSGSSPESKAEKMSMPTSKSDKPASTTHSSEDGTGKSGKMSMPETPGTAPSSKANKPSDGGDGWSGPEAKADKGMSMPPGPEAKSGKAGTVDAKAEKEGSSAKSSKGEVDAKSGKGDSKSGKGSSKMSMPTAKSGKGTADAKAQKESSAKSVKPDPINWSPGYRVVGLP